MTDAEKVKYLEDLILEWWKQFRPMGWSEKAHIENYRVNCANHWDDDLAYLASEISRNRE